MNITGLHILLTYQCTYECDHCFVWGSPFQTGVFTLAQLEDVYQQALSLGTIHDIFFEGGEAFLYYPILLKAVARAKTLGFSVGIVSNNYWATSVEDALAWLRPLLEAMVREVTDTDVVSLHHDISTTTGEEIVVFTLAESPLVRAKKRK